MSSPFSVIERSHPHGVVMKEHAHPAPYLCLLAAGQLVDETPSRRAEFSGGDAFFRPSDEPHQNVFRSAARYCLVMLDPDWVKACGLEQDTQAGVDVFPLQATRRLARLLKRGAASELQVQVTVLELFSALRIMQKDPASGQRYAELLAAINDTADALRHIDAVISRFGMTRQMAGRIVHANTGQTLAAWLRDRRLDHAQDLLQGTAWPLAEIAFRCGYADQAHMSRAVKSALGVTPTTLRKNSNRPV